MIRVALDAMGGDHAPAAEIAGAVRALAELPGSCELLLVGRPDPIEAELARHPDVDRSRLRIVPAPHRSIPAYAGVTVQHEQRLVGL